MPSKSAKQHRFMEAIAHNPAFAKKAGVPQSVGKEFAAADKGKKFVRGGINKQNTHHGKMDMPFNKLNRFAGMKAGGMMKKGRTFAKGGHLESLDDTRSFGAAFKEASKTPGVSTFSWRGKTFTTNTEKPAAKPVNTPITDTAPKAVAASPSPAVARPKPTRSSTDMATLDRLRDNPKPSDDVIWKQTQNNKAAPVKVSAASSNEEPIATMKRGGKVKRFAKGGVMDKGVEKKLPTSKQIGALGMKSGGMKESKAMVGKEVNFMKKKSAPASMIKHEAAEMGAMKYARGGGIESKGKTKGKIIKMAAGGLAGGHKAADGIAQRGKTKGMKVSMKGGGYC
jgi:hypothetical protein